MPRARIPTAQKSSAQSPPIALRARSQDFEDTPMASAAQMQANRKNAQKSTGPKTQKGKQVSRLNAMTHGLTARTVVPVLPQEDPRALDARIQSWMDDWQPRTEQEAELVCHGARLAWQIDRAERFETAHLSKRVRKAQQRAATGAPDLKRLEEVANLGRKLLAPRADVARAVLVARLEATAEGCRWLLERWTEIEGVNARAALVKLADAARFIHLLGKDDHEALSDPGLNALLVAWDVERPGLAADFWKRTCFVKASDDPSFAAIALWRELSPRPESKAEARAIVAHVRDHVINHLKKLLAAHEQLDAEDAADMVDRASFDPGRGFERHLRYRASLGRELLRTIDTLRKLRKELPQEDQTAPQPASPPEENSSKSDQNEATEPSTQAADKKEVASDNGSNTFAKRSQFADTLQPASPHQIGQSWGAGGHDGAAWAEALGRRLPEQDSSGPAIP